MVSSDDSCFHSSKPMQRVCLKNAARTGIEVAVDVIQGRKFKDSVKNRVPVGIKRDIEDIAFQSPPAKRRRGATESNTRRRR